MLIIWIRSLIYIYIYINKYIYIYIHIYTYIHTYILRNSLYTFPSAAGAATANGEGSVFGGVGGVNGGVGGAANVVVGGGGGSRVIGECELPFKIMFY